MKVFAFALATWVFFLMALPTLSEIYSLVKTEQCCEEECCEKSCSDVPKPSEKQDPNDCCPNGICNPLEYCSCCAYLTMDKITLQDKRVSTENSFLLLNERVVSSYHSDSFHPPEIV